MDLCSIVKKPSEIIAEIKMILSAEKRAFLLVEGRVDSKFWSLHIQKNKVEIIVCGQKNAIVDAIIEIDRIGLNLILAIVDDDFDRALGVKYDSANIIATDTHDLETLFLSSSAFDKFLIVHCDSAKITGKSPRDILIDRLLPFAKLRLLNIKNCLEVNFEDGLAVSRFVNEDTLHLDTGSLFCAFEEKCSIQNVESKIGELSGFDDWDLIRGHDAIKLLQIAMRKVFGNAHLKEENIVNALMLAFEEKHLVTTNIYTKIKAWENDNSYSIIAV